MPLALEMVRQLRLEIDQDDADDESINQRVTEETHREEMMFGEPIKPPSEILQMQNSARS